MQCRSYSAMVVSFILALALVLPALSSLTPAPVGAQDASALAAGLPEGVTLDELVAGQITGELAVPAQLRLERATIEPGAHNAAHTAPAPEALYVESGEVIIGDELGIEGLYAAGTSLFIPAGAVYTLRNDGSTPATLLQVTPLPPVTAGAPEATPVAAEAPAAAETLLATDLEALPAAPSQLFLARVTFAPGSDLGENTFAGPVGVLGESGELTVSGPSGIEGKLTEGRGVIFPTGTRSNQRNAGTADTTVLMFGVLPGGSALLGPADASGAVQADTGAPGVEAATASATPATKTLTSDEEPAAEALAPGVLCEADTTGGLDELTGPGWKHLNGMLVSDGSEGGSVSLPCQPDGLNDYAIEVEAQILRPNPNHQCDSALGLRVRTNDDSYVGYSGSIRNVDCTMYARIRANGNDLVKISDLDWDTEWHTYRFEAEGSSIRFLMDGEELLETQDFQFVEGGTVNFYVAWLQTSVRRITIEALGEGVAASGAGGSGDTTAAVTALPDSFLGAWTGTAAQSAPDITWDLSIALVPGAVQEKVGLFSNPTLTCGGSLTLLSATSDSVEVAAKLDYGQDKCVDNGTFTLTQSGEGTLDFVWEGESGGSTTSASGTLTQ